MRFLLTLFLALSQAERSRFINEAVNSRYAPQIKAMPNPFAVIDEEMDDADFQSVMRSMLWRASTGYTDPGNPSQFTAGLQAAGDIDRRVRPRLISRARPRAILFDSAPSPELLVTSWLRTKFPDDLSSAHRFVTEAAGVMHDAAAFHDDLGLSSHVPPMTGDPYIIGGLKDFGKKLSAGARKALPLVASVAKSPLTKGLLKAIPGVGLALSALEIANSTGLTDALKDAVSGSQSKGELTKAGPAPTVSSLRPDVALRYTATESMSPKEVDKLIFEGKLNPEKDLSSVQFADLTGPQSRALLIQRLGLDDYRAELKKSIPPGFAGDLMTGSLLSSAAKSLAPMLKKSATSAWAATSKFFGHPVGQIVGFMGAQEGVEAVKNKFFSDSPNLAASDATGHAPDLAISGTDADLDNFMKSITGQTETPEVISQAVETMSDALGSGSYSGSANYGSSGVGSSITVSKIGMKAPMLRSTLLSSRDEGNAILNSWRDAFLKIDPGFMTGDLSVVPQPALAATILCFGLPLASVTMIPGSLVQRFIDELSSGRELASPQLTADIIHGLLDAASSRQIAANSLSVRTGLNAFIPAADTELSAFKRIHGDHQFIVPIEGDIMMGDLMGSLAMKKGSAASKAKAQSKTKSKNKTGTPKKGPAPGGDVEPGQAGKTVSTDAPAPPPQAKDMTKPAADGTIKSPPARDPKTGRFISAPSKIPSSLNPSVTKGKWIMRNGKWVFAASLLGAGGIWGAIKYFDSDGNEVGADPSPALDDGGSDPFPSPLLDSDVDESEDPTSPGGYRMIQLPFFTGDVSHPGYKVTIYDNLGFLPVTTKSTPNGLVTVLGVGKGVADV